MNNSDDDNHEATHLMVMRRLLPLGTSNFLGCVRKWLIMLDTSSPPACFVARLCLPPAAILRVTRPLADARRRVCTLGGARFLDTLATTRPGRRVLMTACRLVDAAAVLTRARWLRAAQEELEALPRRQKEREGTHRRLGHGHDHRLLDVVLLELDGHGLLGLWRRLLGLLDDRV